MATLKRKTVEVINKSELHTASAATTPTVTLVAPPTILVTLSSSDEAKALNSFKSMLDSYISLGLNRRESLQKILIHSVWYQYSTGKCQLIQKVLTSLNKDSEFNKSNIYKVIKFYTDIAGFRIHQVGNDFQVKRSHLPEFTYDKVCLDACKLDANNYWNLKGLDAEKPYAPKEIDTIGKSFASQVALSLLLGETTEADVEKLISSLKSAIVTAKADPKLVKKAVIKKHQKESPVESWDTDA